MKTIFQTEHTQVIRFDKGEDVIAHLALIANDQQIRGASFTLIGAAEKVTLSYYSLTKKSYEDHVIEEDVEITGVIGNIGWIDKDVVIHAHGSFAKQNLQVIGGHIKSLIISATGEVYLQHIATELVRAYDERTGLNLLI